MLPDHFSFSQASLQDFVDCQRRFALHHLLNIHWPAIPSEPALENEHLLQLGEKFHHMAHQRFLGMPGHKLEGLIRDFELKMWWKNFREQINFDADFQLFPEKSLSMPFGNYRLVAKYDLIVIGADDRLMIYDWKTSRKQPRRDVLAGRMQTKVYPYLLTNVSGEITKGEPVSPENIGMIYWFAAETGHPEQFDYSSTAFESDYNDLRAAIDEIDRLYSLATTHQQEDDFLEIFSLTDHIAKCAFCVYRSLCNRGVKAGQVDDLSEENLTETLSKINLDFEQIAEIEF